MSQNKFSAGIERLTARLRPQLKDHDVDPDSIQMAPSPEEPIPAPDIRIEQNAPSKAPLPRARLVTFGGISCVCNLEWTPSAEDRFTISSPRGFVKLTWADRTTHATGLEFDGEPALLNLVASTLNEADRSGVVMIVVADPERDLWFTAILVDGKPSLERERVFNTQSEMNRHISSVANTSAIARVFASASIIDDLGLVEPAKPLEVPQFDPRDFPTFKRPTPLFSKPVAIGLGAITTTAGAVYLANAFIIPLLFPAPSPQSATPMMSYVEDYGGFQSGCEAAFATPWPTAPGWTLEREGCATKGINDPEVNAALNAPAAAYQVFTLKSQHNAILARRTAEMIYANYPHQAVGWIAANCSSSNLFP